MLGSKRLIPAILCGAFLTSLVACSVFTPLGNVTVQTYSPITQSASPVEAAEVTLTGFITGWVKAPANILIDQSHADLPNMFRRPRWVPSVAYAVEHSQFGTVLLDTGLKPGQCDYGDKVFYWVPCRNEPGDDLVSQLQSQGILASDIKAVLVSHFHGDHISGLRNLLSYTDAPLFLTDRSYKSISSPFRFMRGIPGDMLDMHITAELVEPAWQSHPHLREVFDVFGDASLLVFRTPGHTVDHLSAMVTVKEEQILLAFDAVHTRANWDFNVPSGSVVSSHIAQDSLKFLRAVAAQPPVKTVIFGHEPDQWVCADGAVKIASASDLC